MIVSLNRYICDCLIQMINTVLSLCSLNREFCTGYNATAFAVTDFLQREVNNHFSLLKFTIVPLIPLGYLLLFY